MKTGLVVEGGGMKCAYNAGILDAFLDEQISFDYCVGVSAAAGNIASYLAGQRERNLRFYTEHLHDPYYFGLRSLLKTGDLFNIRRIYGTMSYPDGIDPIDFDALMANPSELELVVTNAADGSAEYHSKRELKRDDFRLFMASCAIPAVCKPIELDGKLYYDGGMSDAIPVERAFAQGCDRVVVILSKPRDYVRKKQGMLPVFALRCRKTPAMLDVIKQRHIAYNALFQRVLRLEAEGKLFLFAPDGSIHVGTYTMDENVERALYDAGMRDFAARREELRAYLAQ